MIPLLESHEGLQAFAKERAKFEGWFKVEVCKLIMLNDREVIPEHNRIDVTFDDWALELKTINTSYKYGSAKKKQRPITRNISGVLADAQNLSVKAKKFSNRAVLFVVFPLKHSNEKWRSKHYTRLVAGLKNIRRCEFKFLNELPGVLYFAKI